MRISKICMLAALLLTSMSCTSKDYVSCRPDKADRLFVSEAVDAKIEEIKPRKLTIPINGKMQMFAKKLYGVKVLK